jgi:hypothetical protein
MKVYALEYLYKEDDFIGTELVGIFLSLKEAKEHYFERENKDFYDDCEISEWEIPVKENK